MTPEECTEIDFKEISACDLFVAFPGAPASPGTHIEIGWASALNKPIVLLLEEEKDYAFLINGLGTIANVTFIRFRTEEDYFSQLDKVYLQIV
ncbi:nucleoside 2-deoxyribosyltransferase [Shouchella miscanthi]|nr:nucleoside 2-deoxyribosyltransferase [Shouchella miscanthi]